MARRSIFFNLVMHVATLNTCQSCGYGWRPRGRSRSVRCPQCRSSNVTHPAGDAATTVGTAAVSGVVGSAKLLHAGAKQIHKGARTARPHLVQLAIDTGEILRLPIRWALAPFRWLISIRYDFLNQTDTNPFSLIAKIAVWVIILAGSGIWVIKTLKTS